MEKGQYKIVIFVSEGNQHIGLQEAVQTVTSERLLGKEALKDCTKYLDRHIGEADQWGRNESKLEKRRDLTEMLNFQEDTTLSDGFERYQFC